MITLDKNGNILLSQSSDIHLSENIDITVGFSLKNNTNYDLQLDQHSMYQNSGGFVAFPPPIIIGGTTGYWSYKFNPVNAASIGGLGYFINDEDWNVQEGHGNNWVHATWLPFTVTLSDTYRYGFSVDGADITIYEHS